MDFKNTFQKKDLWKKIQDTITDAFLSNGFWRMASEKR